MVDFVFISENIYKHFKLATISENTGHTVDIQ